MMRVALNVDIENHSVNATNSHETDEIVAKWRSA